MASPALGGGGTREEDAVPGPVYAVPGDGRAPGWGAGGFWVVDVAVSGKEVVGVGSSAVVAVDVAVGVGCTAVAPGWGGAGGWVVV